MSQYFIRKLAGYGPVRRAWSQLHVPPIVSAIYSVWYLVVLVIGVYSSFNPLRTIEAVAGDMPVSAIAGL